MAKFCPKCGKSTDELIFDLCKDCYFKENDLLEGIKGTNIEFCEVCGKVKTNNWATRRDENYLEKEIEKNIKPKKGVTIQKVKVDYEIPELPENKKKASSFANVKITAKLDNKKVTLDYEVPFSILYTRCPICMKISNGYYEGILQLRPREHKSFYKVCRFVEKSIEKQTKFGVVLTGKEELEEGNNYLVSKKMYLFTLAGKIISYYGGTIDTHYTLVTKNWQTSKDVTRLTVVVRLPEFEKGDAILIKDKVMIVNKVKKSSIFGSNVERTKKINYDYKKYKATMICKRKNMEKDNEGNLTFEYNGKMYKTILDDDKDNIEQE